MKPVASSVTSIDTIEGEEVKFSISEANSAWIMRSMADLYSVRELACVREYSTNGYDANLEYAIATGMQKPDPIQVTLPTAYNPYFVVQDTGVGMSLKTLKEVYTQFGESTKRDSDDFNGMLGFGSKSAVAYTNTFTVTSVRDGLKNIAVISRREDAMGGYLVTLKVVMADVATDEHSGTKIEIPVHNTEAFSKIARDFYRFWKPGTVLLNGEEPKWEVGDKIADNLYYAPTHYDSYVVMGNVPYRIANPRALFPSGMNAISFVAYVPMGTVEFTPNREELKYSEHTKNNLHKIINDFADEARKKAKDEVTNAKSHWEAYNAWTKWCNILGRQALGDLFFKGEKLATTITVKGSHYNTGYGRYNTQALYNDHYDINKVPHTVFVTDFKVGELVARHKKIARDWAAFKGISATNFVFSPEAKIKSPWVDPGRVVDWETMKAEAPKPARKKSAPNPAWGRKAGTFDLATSSGRESEQDVPNVKNLLYMSVQDFNRIADGSWARVSNFLTRHKITDKVVIVPANRKEKFLRNYKATYLMDHLAANVQTKGSKLLDADAMEYLGYDSSAISIAERLKGQEIDDPDIVRIVELAKKQASEYTSDYHAQKSLCNDLGLTFETVKLVEDRYYQAKKNPFGKYPLVRDSYYNFNPKHAALYINAVYNN